MTSGQIIRTCGLSLAVSLFTVGCFTKKSEEVAEATAAPPPAAYPAGEASTSSPNSGSYAAPAPDAPASTAYAPVPSTSRSARKAAPFSLRGNEKLVPHTVVSGDTLGALATRYGTSVSRIQSANEMSSSKIFTGKVIQIPSSGQASYAANTSAPAPPAATPPVYGASSATSPPVAPVHPSSTSYRSSVPAAGSSTGGYTGTDGSTTGGVSSPAGTYPRIESSTPPPTAPQSGSALPTPSFGGSGIQFSD